MTRQQVQQEVERIANLHELGALQRDYRLHIGCLLSILIPTYLISFSFIVVMLIIAIKFAGLWAVPSLILVLLACIWAYGLVIGFRSIHQNRHSGKFLYTHGLLAMRYQDQQIRVSEAIHWRDIAIIWHDIKRGYRGRPFHLYRLQRSDGSFFGQDVDKDCDQGNIHFGPLDRSLGKHVERMVLPYLWPLILSAYEQGSPVEFGPLTLHANGIQSQSSFLPWSWFERLAEDNSEGQLFIIPKKGKFAGLRRVWTRVPSVQGKEVAYLQPINPWAVVPYAQVPNLYLFLCLIQSITGNSLLMDNPRRISQEQTGG